MDAIQLALDYHERTKHHFHRYAKSTGYLDWANQPDPFRRFDGAPIHQLGLTGESPSPGYDELFNPGAIAPQPVNIQTVSQLFEFSLALSAWKEFQGSRWALRINPSSGNLHPTEGYLVIGPVAGLHDAPAVYHYAPQEHALERRTTFDVTIWHELLASRPVGTFFVGLTSIHWREAWKYGERAYRYCQHDVGHALAAIALSVSLQGWTSELLDIDDATIAAFLGIDRESDFTDAEREHSDLLLAISPAVSSEPRAQARGQVFPEPRASARAESLSPSALAQITAGAWSGQANPLSRDHVDWSIIDETAAACRRTAAVAQSEPFATFDAAIQPTRPPLPARRIIRQRRSAVAFDGKTSITAEQFYLMLDRVLPRCDRPPWNALGPPACVHLALFVHLVEGLPKGLYFLVRDPESVTPLREACDPIFAWERPAGCPEGLPLYQLRLGDARRVAAQVSCGQEIAGASAFSLGMIAEFDEPLRRHGPWFYRRLFWETGVIGQVLYLEAEAAGVRATGIGCFFDDPVHELLGLKDHRFQSLYHFTVGGPVDDPRLTTSPPYPQGRAANPAGL